MRTKMLTSRIRNNEDRQRSAKPFCQCWNESRPTPWISTDGCACGEHSDISEWRWEMPDNAGTSWVVMCQDQKQVTFHPYYSSGTAAVKGDTALVKDYHYYWEVKMLTEPYGTDIMVGLGTNKVNMSDSLFTFTSFLGRDAESYGLSYTGALRHDTSVCRDNTGFCKGSIIGVKVDLWQGTLEFYLNRKSQGISFYNLRRHQALYPMICSTAAQSSMRLIYAASWQASLLVDAAKILASSVQGDQRLGLPPGLRCTLKNQFWLTLPNQKCILDEDDMQPETTQKPSKSSTSMDLEPTVDVSPRRLLDQMRVMRDAAHNLEDLEPTVDVSPRRLLDQLRVLREFRDAAHDLEVSNNRHLAVTNNRHLAVTNNRRSHLGENELDDEPEERRLRSTLRNSVRQTFETYRRFNMN